ncbi:hypothetical protein AWZ03_011244 [Drosophila navojoa]|uniref:Uncharacterized protein n=1 Tax=Drosophila navojoa TaxID=7232 RepID=A0A484B227_DRONA|nr:hypothetical protein AWZ03_011244 [Drosophila navojoa]
MDNTTDIDEEIRQYEREIETLLNINRRLVTILNFVDHVGNSLDALSQTANRYLTNTNAMLITNPEDANTPKEPDNECVDGSDADKKDDNEDFPEN